MAVRLISDSEKLFIDIEGARFYYRRMPAHVRAGIESRFTNNRTGKTDWTKASVALLDYCLLNWQDVVDTAGNSVAFTKELIKFIPDTVQADIIAAVGENTDQVETEAKNLSSTQDSSSEITDSPAKRAEKGL